MATSKVTPASPFFVLVLFCATICSANARNSSAVFPLAVTDPGLFAIFPPSIITIETPIAVRDALIFVVVSYNVAAACDKVALNFWGERKSLPQSICADKEEVADLNIYGILRAYELEFPEQSASYAKAVKAAGIDPDDRSTDLSTGKGFGNAEGIRVAQWFAQNGWNALGDKTRDHYLQPYEDFTGFSPINSPYDLTFPLRWQPLTQHRGFGRYIVQRHVVPFLGSREPLALTTEQVESRVAPSPFAKINARKIKYSDARRLDARIRDLFETSAGLTPEQRVLASFWDNKFGSLGVIPAFVLPLLKLDGLFDTARWGLGEMIAQYDAIIVAWKEKRRFDAVRPPTAVDFLYRGRMVKAYVPAEKKVMKVKAEDWEPLIPAQPHSEYPSASAVICEASFEHSKFLTEEALARNNLTVAPPITIPISGPGAAPVGFDTEGLTSLNFKDYE